MPHFMTLIDNKCLGALNFTDLEMRPRPRELTIKQVGKGKPPAGGKLRWEFHFHETEKTAFFSTGQLKKLANMLMCADPDMWPGVKITVTCGPVKNPKGGEETMGMLITNAVRVNQQQKPQQRPTETEDAQT